MSESIYESKTRVWDMCKSEVSNTTLRGSGTNVQTSVGHLSVRKELGRREAKHSVKNTNSALGF